MNYQKLGLTFKPMDSRNINTIDTLFFHHKGGEGDGNNIHQYHLSLGWSGAGYNWEVLRNGTVQELRPINFVPAGVYGWNERSVHICYEGNIETSSLTAEQINVTNELIAYIKHLIPSIKYVYGHGEKYNTDCPGKLFPLGIFKSIFNTPVAPVVNTPKICIVTASILNVRESPNGTILGQVKQGQTFKVDRVDGEWTSIFYGEHGGYVYTPYIRLI